MEKAAIPLPLIQFGGPARPVSQPQFQSAPFSSAPQPNVPFALSHGAPVCEQNRTPQWVGRYFVCLWGGGGGTSGYLTAGRYSPHRTTLRNPRCKHPPKGNPRLVEGLSHRGCGTAPKPFVCCFARQCQPPLPPSLLTELAVALNLPNLHPSENSHHT
jgi:hypothetical protein